MAIVVFAYSVNISVVVENEGVVFSSPYFLDLFAVDFCPLNWESLYEVVLVQALKPELLVVVQSKAVYFLFGLGRLLRGLQDYEGTEVRGVDPFNPSFVQTSKGRPVHSAHLVVLFELVAKSSFGMVSKAENPSPAENQNVIHPGLDVLNTVLVKHVVFDVLGDVLLHQNFLGTLDFSPKKDFRGFRVGTNGVAFPSTNDVHFLGEIDFGRMFGISLPAQLI